MAMKTTIWPSRRSWLGLRVQGAQFHLQLVKKLAVSECEGFAIHLAYHAFTGDRTKLSSLAELKSPILRPANDGGGERMLAPALEGCGQAEHFHLIPSLQGMNRSKTRLSLRKRTSLVHNERVHFFENFKRFGVLINTPARAPRPVPTMMDIGVASPSAQGQAMIRTATAFTSA